MRWTWNVSQALLERATQPGQSYEVSEENVVRALAAPLIEFMDTARASSRERQEAAAFGSTILADRLKVQADYIERELLGRKPEDDEPDPPEERR